jgi:hypothetical protein
MKLIPETEILKATRILAKIEVEILAEIYNRNQNIEKLKTSENSAKTKKLKITEADSKTETKTDTVTKNKIF